MWTQIWYTFSCTCSLKSICCYIGIKLAWMFHERRTDDVRATTKRATFPACWNPALETNFTARYFYSAVRTSLQCMPSWAIVLSIATWFIVLECGLHFRLPAVQVHTVVWNAGAGMWGAATTDTEFRLDAPSEASRLSRKSQRCVSNTLEVQYVCTTYTVKATRARPVHTEFNFFRTVRLQYIRNVDILRRFLYSTCIYTTFI
jgi:hypothetical protein